MSLDNTSRRWSRNQREENNGNIEMSEGQLGTFRKLRNGKFQPKVNVKLILTNSEIVLKDSLMEVIRAIVVGIHDFDYEDDHCLQQNLELWA